MERTNLIVGGTGFIGGHLAEHFFAEGEISKGVFRKGSHLRIMDQCGIQCLEADLMDRHSLHEPLDGVEVVYSLASPPPGARSDEYVRFNEGGLRNLLEEALEHGTRTFVHLSTLDVYGFSPGGAIAQGAVPHPTDDYQRSKLQGEKMVAEFGRDHPELQVRTVRAAKAVGSRDPVMVIPILKMMERGRVILPSGSATRLSFTHPRDVAQALLRASTSAGDTGPLQVRSFDATLEELARALVRAGGKSAEVKQQGVFSGKSMVAPYASDEVRAGLTLGEQDSWGRIGYSPAYDLDKTVAEVSAWSRKEPWVARSSE